MKNFDYSLDIPKSLEKQLRNAKYIGQGHNGIIFMLSDKKIVKFFRKITAWEDEKCHMALVCSKKDGNFILDLGLMNINSQGKAEASLECGTNNIGNLDVSYDKIIGAVVYKEIGGKVIYLMCGFLNGQQPKDNWKVYNILSKHGLIKKSKNDGSKKNEEKHNTNNKVEKENNEQRTV